MSYYLPSSKVIYDFDKISKDKYLITSLLKKIEEFVCLHAEKQIKAGANIIQIFDSWAGLLPKKELLNYCYIPTLKIVKHIQSLKIPAICFPKGIGENYVDFCSAVKPNCINIDYDVDPNFIKEKSGVRTASVEKLKELFSRSKRPLLLLGGGSWSDKSVNSICKFAKNNNLPGLMLQIDFSKAFHSIYFKLLRTL